MADLDPGVVLSQSTVDAMNRLAQHRATPEQWASLEQAREPMEVHPGVFIADKNTTLATTILELRARVEALEEQNWIAKMAPQRPDEGQLWVDPKGVTRERRGTSWVRVPGPPAPAGSLVERVGSAVIREVAAWLRVGRLLHAAELLEQEADRG
jgi:hypothetical protein